MFNFAYSLYFFKCKLILTIKSQIMKDFEAEISLHYSCTIFIPLCIRAVTQTNPQYRFCCFYRQTYFWGRMTTTFISLSWCSAFCTEKGSNVLWPVKLTDTTRGAFPRYKASSASCAGG